MIKAADIKKAAAEAVIQASTSFRPDQVRAYERAIAHEKEGNAKWILETMLKNAVVAEQEKLPLCDDTGIPYASVEIGDTAEVDGGIGSIFSAVQFGVGDGLRSLPGRPMAVKGSDQERIMQSRGLHDDPGMVVPTPIRMTTASGSKLSLTVVMLGGGPEIRSRTYRVFHRHDHSCLQKKVIDWAAEMVGALGCTPCVPIIGIGRTHYEATCLVMDAMANKVFGEENEFEKSITSAINGTHVGALGVGGSITALGSFVVIGPQRASGVRIVSLRVGCCIDPRRHTVVLS